MVSEQRFGPHNILLIEDMGTDKHHHKIGKFLCPYEHEDGSNHYFVSTFTDVRTGKKESCGCIKKPRKKRSLEEKVKNDNVLNKQFGRLKVIKPLYINNHGSVVYDCVCECGKHKEAIASALKRKGVQSCGCLVQESHEKRKGVPIPSRRKDLTGQQCGTWTAIRPLNDNSGSGGNVYWLCKCENGHYNKISTSGWGKIKTCRECKNSNVSIGESVIQTILEENNIKFKKEKKFNNCVYIRPLRFDFYLPDYNCCIEYDGIQHFQPTNFSHDNFKDRQKRDLIKTEYCQKHNIRLLRIPYTDLDKLTDDYLLDLIKKI